MTSGRDLCSKFSWKNFCICSFKDTSQMIRMNKLFKSFFK
ncbi:hypothetical protein PRO82_001123 [Candidatus Protochlamydia amoebophila]|nr:hypothetical protein [Candidatus Protochlamydia amoebophila]